MSATITALSKTTGNAIPLNIPKQKDTLGKHSMLVCAQFISVFSNVGNKPEPSHGSYDLAGQQHFFLSTSPTDFAYVISDMGNLKTNAGQSSCSLFSKLFHTGTLNGSSQIHAGASH
ncbi:hypothetical protein CEUSTIGMA_g6828.t1 [Chlamydomonas eustigma]|uniref:Uncharacterized protein n=1 Tax=Chlamydomonas eustigma TaxID=1157962 RepID=A0A250X8K2_9CHLO|nr:hypothetical protein CEUSTIGMA_g6828.t1 [Chlamydomonas eustigma]|eukprot:GAX79386.1 hypothetical protein CEUSTIGMA_g6828.t1 [Chlamydomonas eustigma]